MGKLFLVMFWTAWQPLPEIPYQYYKANSDTRTRTDCHLFCLSSKINMESSLACDYFAEVTVHSVSVCLRKPIRVKLSHLTTAFVC